MHYHGHRQFTLMHRDGTKMLSLDGYTDEILRILASADIEKDGKERFASVIRIGKDRREQAKESALVAGEECRRETDRRHKVWCSGSSPFIAPKSVHGLQLQSA